VTITSDVPLTIQRYACGASYWAGGCESNPLLSGEGIILVTSKCDTRQTGLIPEISLGSDDALGYNKDAVSSINITLGVLPEDAGSVDFLEPSSYLMTSSFVRRPFVDRPLDNDDVPSSRPYESMEEQNAVFSPRSLIFGLFALARGVASTGLTGRSQPRPRLLDTCIYNAEVFINGCERVVNATAPKVRVADAIANLTEDIAAGEEGEYYVGVSVEFTFPKDRITSLGNASDAVTIDRASEDCHCCICVGRPYIDSSGSMLQASPLITTDDTCSWSADASASDCEGTEKLSPSQNEILLGNEWTMSALGEHASIASFAAFSIALMTNGAPSDLVRDALEAGLDEVRHANISFEIASKLTGKDVRPGHLPESKHAFRHNMTELAMAVAKEGCIDETLSALAAAADAEVITNVLMTGIGGSKYLNIAYPTLVWIRDELEKIALDEGSHSALAWRTLKWVCTVDSEACKAVNEAILEGDQLAMAYDRRFLHTNINNQTDMGATWKKMYAVLKKSSQSNDSALETHGFVCDDIESAEGFDKGTSFSAILANNILQNVMCYNA